MSQAAFMSQTAFQILQIPGGILRKERQYRIVLPLIALWRLAGLFVLGV